MLRDPNACLEMTWKTQQVQWLNRLAVELLSTKPESAYHELVGWLVADETVCADLVQMSNECTGEVPEPLVQLAKNLMLKGETHEEREKDTGH